MLRNCAVNFVEICNVYVGKMVIKTTKRIFDSDKICRSYSDLNFGVTFLEHSVLSPAPSFYRAAYNADAVYSDENSVRPSVRPSVRHRREL